MARTINRLSARRVASTKWSPIVILKDGGVRSRPRSRAQRIPDGGGLYLQVDPTSAKSWLFRFMLNGQSWEMGLGSVISTSLAEARVEADRCRKLLKDRINPIEHRKQDRALRQSQAASSRTFKDCAERYIQSHQAGWKNVKHASQWENTLKTYAYPEFGKLPVHMIDTGSVMRVLEPIWTTKTETASRVRGRIEAVLDWATVQGYRSGDNPARWKGHLKSLLPDKNSVRGVEHQRALPYEQIGTFIKKLRGMDGVSPRALEFQILTGVRPGEALGARWPEIDLDKAVWTVPGLRMKGRKGQGDHKVPLSKAAVALLKVMHPLKGKNDFVFPGGAAGRPLSDMAPMALLERMGFAAVTTAHGFRSTFRDWGAETTAFPNEVLEMALAHKVSDKVEAAYRRGDLFEKRRRLMDAWEVFANKVQSELVQGKVVQLGAR